MPVRDVIAWNSLMLAYAEDGETSIALDLFTSMDCQPDSVTFITALKACGILADKKSSQERGVRLLKTKALHRRIGPVSDIVLATVLVETYGKCGGMLDARTVFDTMFSRNVITWNSLILGYVENGDYRLALELLARMDCEPDTVSFLAGLRACAGLAGESGNGKRYGLLKGRVFHEELRRRERDAEVTVSNALLDMYTKCGSMSDAEQVFDGMERKDVVSWTCLIAGYVENGESSVAMGLFMRMSSEPDALAYVSVLKACSTLPVEKRYRLEKGREIHEQIRVRHLDSELVVQNSLLDMYTKCGCMMEARKLFDVVNQRTVVTWNTLLLGYVESGESLTALDLFRNMNCEPDPVTFIAVVKAVTSLLASPSSRELWLEKGMLIHKQVKEKGLESHTSLSNTLLEMYSKSGSMSCARAIFDRMVRKTTVSWNCLILGYVENGESLAALEVFSNMDCEPDSFTYVAVLKACGSLSRVSIGKDIHARVCKLGLELEPMLGNSLVNLYARCGCMDVCEHVFNGLTSHYIVSWNAILTGYAVQGDTTRVFALVAEMKEAGESLDGISFIAILTSCSHAGMVDEGKEYFECMQRCGVTQTVEHYNCLVDMLGRSNRLPEALSVVAEMPFEEKTVAWLTLLGACKKWKSFEITKVVV